MTKLSDTALVLLGKAAQNDDRFAEPPKHLPAAARNAVVRSLLEQGLLIEDAVALNHPMAWRTDDSDADGGGAELRCSIALRITDAGFRAIGRTVDHDRGRHRARTRPPAEADRCENAADDADTVPLRGDGRRVATRGRRRSPTPSTPPRRRPRRGPTCAPPPPRCSPPGTTRTTATPTSSPPSRRRWRRSAPCSPRRRRARRPRRASRGRGPSRRRS
jgi:hypothetical protein